MVLRYDGKVMTQFEAQMYAAQRCICCGSANVLYRDKHGVQKQRQECELCSRARTRFNVGSGTARDRDFGATRASLHHEYARRLGYGSAAARAEDTKNWSER